jgi:uncharacterized protein DUF5753
LTAAVAHLDLECVRHYTDQLPRSFERLADLQADAKAIGFYETGIVPGLAQTPDYAKSVIAAFWWKSPENEAERLLSFRIDQQRRVLESEPPKELTFVLTETALDQVVGSAAVMRSQLLHLLQIAERPNTAVQIIRRDTPNNPLLGGGLITLDFADAAPRIAFAASHGPATYHDQEADTGPMFCAFQRAQELALAPRKSADLLLAKLKDMPHEL